MNIWANIGHVLKQFLRSFSFSQKCLANTHLTSMNLYLGVCMNVFYWGCKCSILKALFFLGFLPIAYVGQVVCHVIKVVTEADQVQYITHLATGKCGIFFSCKQLSKQQPQIFIFTSYFSSTVTTSPFLHLLSSSLPLVIGQESARFVLFLCACLLQPPGPALLEFSQHYYH